jgi:hypothetical protein
MATIKAGGDFTTVSAWAADIDGDTLLANTSGLVSGTITESSQIHFQNVTLGIFTLTLTADTGQSFVDHADKATNALRYNTANGAAVTSSYADLNIDIDVVMAISKLQLRKTGNYTRFVDASVSLALSQCIVLANAVGLGGEVVRLDGGGSVENCLIYKNGALNVADALLKIGGGGTANNVTLANTGSGTVATGLRSAYGTLVAKNVAVFGATTDASGTLTGSTNNATDSAGGGFPSTGRQNSLVGATEWESVTDGSEDFRVKSSTSVKLLDFGTSTGTPSTDIVGQTRTGSYDIGAWEYQAGGGGGGSKLPIIHQQM